MADPLLKADATKDNLVDQIQDLQERLAELERFALTSQNILANKIGVGNANLDDIDSGDIATIPWTDHSSLSTITGWSSTTEEEIWYKKIGKFVWVHFRIQGTSDDTSTIFTVPYNKTSSGAHVVIPCLVKNDGTRAIGYLVLNGATVTFYRDAAGNVWTASGTKEIFGQFCYEAA